MADPINWAPAQGRELRADGADKNAPQRGRVVACLNVWNDCAALRLNLPTWIEEVGHVIAVDGAYATVGVAGPSDDGTLDYLRYEVPERHGVTVRIIAQEGPWASQIEKRNAYFAAADWTSDILFVIDADEQLLVGKGVLAGITERPFDVGWVRMRSSLYKREYGTPRVFRLRSGIQYRGRHHWTYAGDRLMTTHQYGGPGFEHITVPITLENRRSTGRSESRLAARSRHARKQLANERILVALEPASRMSDTAARAREALRIVHVGKYDPGIAMSRLHAAVNCTTPHASLQFTREQHPFAVPRQFDASMDKGILARALREADVAHWHASMRPAAYFPRARWNVMHHHGSVLRHHPSRTSQTAARFEALELVATLELFNYTGNRPVEWLPNPIPVARYHRLRLAGMRERMRDEASVLSYVERLRRFRIAHSPSKRGIKGTAEFERVCARLHARGVPVEFVVIENATHAFSLWAKARADAVFDAFWLGIQMSGLEGAAMGLPVIAGDPIVRDRYIERLGECPYTYANTEEELEAVIERLALDDDYRTAESDRVSRYVREYHDEATVALRYLDLLDARFGWRSALAI